MLHSASHGSYKVRFWWRADGFEPSADIDLRVCLPAEVASPGGVCRLRIPFQDSELVIAALNDEPVNRVVGNASANFTAEFLESCHALHLVS